MIRIFLINCCRNSKITSQFSQYESCIIWIRYTLSTTRKQSSPNFLKNEHFLPPDTYTCVCVLGGKKCSFFGKLGVLCFFVTPVLRFTLLAYCQRLNFHINFIPYIRLLLTFPLESFVII